MTKPPEGGYVAQGPLLSNFFLGAVDVQAYSITTPDSSAILMQLGQIQSI